MKKLLCLFTLLVLITATVYAEPKKDTHAGLDTFTEEQVQSVYGSVKNNFVIGQELKTLLNEEVKENKKSEIPQSNFKPTRLKKFFDSDPYGVKKYADTSTAILDTYNKRCGEREVHSTDDINWSVEKSGSKNSVSLYRSTDGAHLLYFREYDFGIECPNGGVYIAYRICFLLDRRQHLEQNLTFSQYVDCDVYRANINRE